MSDSKADSGQKILWTIGTIALFFNLLGCMNFFSQMNADSVAAMPVAYRVIVETRPAWATAAFAIAVFGGAVAAIFLLLRKSVSMYVFGASLIGAIVAQLPLVLMAGVPAGALVGGLGQVLVTAFLAWYSWWAHKKGFMK